MLSSISGQNERWARLDAHQPPPPSAPGQKGVSILADVSKVASTASGAATATGGVSSPLADDVSLALIGFGGGGAAAAASGSGGGASGSVSGSTGGSGIGSQLLTQLQSLLATLPGRRVDPGLQPLELGVGPLADHDPGWRATIPCGPAGTRSHRTAGSLGRAVAGVFRRSSLSRLIPAADMSGRRLQNRLGSPHSGGSGSAIAPGHFLSVAGLNGVGLPWHSR